MSDPLRFVAPRVAFVDPNTGVITREWYLFLQGIFIRIGGANGASTTDITASLFEDAGSSETNALLFAAEQSFGQNPLPLSVADQSLDQSLVYQQFTPVDLLQAEVSELREIVAELKKDLDALRQGILI